MRWKLFAFLLPWLLTGAFVAYAVITSHYHIHNCGCIHTIGLEVYKDQECTQLCTSISWGTLYPGETVTRVVYAKLLGNTPATLIMTYGNWTPSEAQNYITLSWNYTGDTLNPWDVLPIEFTLSVAENITGIEQFEFYITITASG
ncbi:MAG: hypothetical protein QXT44_07435 [Candidatus Bathyarchaeia archaeon]